MAQEDANKACATLKKEKTAFQAWEENLKVQWEVRRAEEEREQERLALRVQEEAFLKARSERAERAVMPSGWGQASMPHLITHHPAAPAWPWPTLAYKLNRNEKPKST